MAGIVHIFCLFWVAKLVSLLKVSVREILSRTTSEPTKQLIASYPSWTFFISLKLVIDSGFISSPSRLEGYILCVCVSISFSIEIYSLGVIEL